MRFLASLLFILSLGFSQVIVAQNLQNLNPQSVNVENLTEQQIQQLLQEAQNRGLSITQIEQLAVVQGMSQQQASRLAQRMQQVQSAISRGAGEAGSISNRLRVSTVDSTRQAAFFDQFFGAGQARDSLLLNQTLEQLRYQTRQDSIRLAQRQLRDRIFGFELFRTEGDQPVFQPSLNIPTPVDYRLGPGDELFIDIWGAARRVYQLQVTPEGMVNIEELGPIFVNGLTIEEARQRLTERLGEIYSGLTPENPANRDTFMQVSLGQVRSIQVTVLGEVTRPGTYTIPSLATLFNALYSAGGPSVTGTFRNIQVIRNNAVVSTFDLYDFLIYGEQSANIRLQDQDIIKIDPYMNRVEITGEVKRTGIYETLDNETLQDLVTFAGGFTGSAYSERLRIEGSSGRERTIRDIERSRFDEAPIRNGDFVAVERILDRFQNMVEIRGAVFREGRYELTDTTTLYSLIQRADGLRGDAFMNRGIIYRENPDYTIQSIPFSVSQLMQDPGANDIPLRENDRIQISSIFDLREDYSVNIEGAILQPDRYQYVENMTLEDLIYQAGGFRETAAPYRIEVARRTEGTPENLSSVRIADIFLFQVDETLQLNGESADFTLQPFDNVYVRSAPNYEVQQNVSIGGQVHFTGKYALESENDRISDLIERAGGLTQSAYLDGATLYRPLTGLQEEEPDLEGGLFTQEIPATTTTVNNIDLQLQQLQAQREGTRERITLAQIGINLGEIINNPGSRFDLFLEEGDSLYIPEELQTVVVKGGVFYPTGIRFDDRRSYRDYISMAGGFTNLARKNDAYVIYANGDVDRTKNFLFFKNYPEVRPGATIVVPEKSQGQRLSPQERVGLLSAIVSTAALITTTILQLRR